MSGYPPLVEALLQPEAYPETPASVELVTTHISYIFLTGRYVYKVKKPVDFGFLNFTSLEKRRHFCHQEVALNRRLSPDVYLDVVEIRQDDGHFTVDGPGKTVEYAVKMRQLPRHLMMDQMLRRGEITPTHIQRIAQKIADFHLKAESNQQIALMGGPDTARQNVLENFAQTEAYIGQTIAQATYDDLITYSQAFLEVQQCLFLARVNQGKVRDCHGDLHTAQICIENGISIIDCIEFNERFRYSDVASDIAFLAMDLDHHGQPNLSRVLINAYITFSGDGGVRDVLDFYKVYRAYVRGKVESFKLTDPEMPKEAQEAVKKTAQAYFSLAHSYVRAMRPTSLYITVGLTGTGKSLMAERLAECWDLQLVSSDVVRKRLAGISLTEHRYVPYHEGIYAEDFTHKTYDEMFREAAEFLKAGKSVILDASFIRAGLRQQAVAVARAADADAYVLECVAPRDIVLKRLERRLFQENVVSDGREAIYRQQMEDFEPVQEVSPQNHIVVDTSGTPRDMMVYTLGQLYRQMLTEGKAAVGETR